MLNTTDSSDAAGQTLRAVLDELRDRYGVENTLDWLMTRGLAAALVVTRAGTVPIPSAAGWLLVADDDTACFRSVNGQDWDVPWTGAGGRFLQLVLLSVAETERRLDLDYWLQDQAEPTLLDEMLADRTPTSMSMSPQLGGRLAGLPSDDILPGFRGSSEGASS